MKRELNKWQFVHSCNKAIMYNQLGWRICSFGIVKVTTFPIDGVMISKMNYKGFLLEWYLWLPWDRRR